MLNSNIICCKDCPRGCDLFIFTYKSVQKKGGGGLNLRNRVLPSPQSIQSIKIQKDDRHKMQLTVSW